MKDLKGILSSLVAFLLVIAEPINAWLISGQDFNWRNFASACLVAVVAVLTGRNNDGTKKTENQLDEQQAKK